MNNAMVMVDLETLGTAPDSIIASIGAQGFTIEGLVGDAQELILNRAEQAAEGRTIHLDTIDWWMDQSSEARAMFSQPKVSVRSALNYFSYYVKATAGDPEKAVLWGNGADFDLVLLGSLYDSFKLERPWRYFNNRCFRTLKNLLPTAYKVAKQTIPANLIKHSAKEDAKWQALIAVQLLQTYYV